MHAYLQLSTDFTATDGQCYCVTKKCAVRVERCVEMYRGRAPAEYLRLSPVTLEQAYENVPLTQQTTRAAERGRTRRSPTRFDSIWRTHPIRMSRR